jgi:hypothetical protein
MVGQPQSWQHLVYLSPVSFSCRKANVEWTLTYVRGNLLSSGCLPVSGNIAWRQIADGFSFHLCKEPMTGGIVRSNYGYYNNHNLSWSCFLRDVRPRWYATNKRSGPFCEHVICLWNTSIPTWYDRTEKFIHLLTTFTLQHFLHYEMCSGASCGPQRL